MQEIDINNINDEYLLDLQYDIRIKDMIVCPNCRSIFESDNYNYTISDKVDVIKYNGFDDYDSFEKDYDIEMIECPYCKYSGEEDEFRGAYTDDLYEAPNVNEYIPNFKENNIKESELSMETENKIESLTEATIKALYSGLKDDEVVDDVEGIIDDVLVVTDPEITTEEYNELIDRAQEIVEETPEGEIPVDPTYLGEYVQICPICGGSFVEDHVLEPGTACPICYETPESFVMVGKLQAEDTVAEDNGLVNDDEDTIDDENTVIDTTEINEDGNVEDVELDIAEKSTEKMMPIETQEEINRPRGARLRRNRDVASKEIPIGNKLTETLEEEKDPEEGFEIDLDNAYKVDGIKVGNVVASYKYDTNTVVFYDEELGEDLDTIVYRNQTPEEIKEYMTSEIGLNLKENKIQENVDDEKYNIEKDDNITKTYKVSFYVDSSETPKDRIKEVLSNALTGTGLASIKDDIEIELYNTLEEDDEISDEGKDKKLLLGDEQNDENKQQEKIDKSTNSEYELIEATEEQIRELKKGSAFTWEGMDISDENLQLIVDDLKKNTKIILPVKFYTWKGSLFNAMYGLTGKNAYNDDLNFLSIDLDNWSALGVLPIYKMEVGARWLDDIVDNNAIRQNNVDNNEE